MGLNRKKLNTFAEWEWLLCSSAGVVTLDPLETSQDQNYPFDALPYLPINKIPRKKPLKQNSGEQKSF